MGIKQNMKINIHELKSKFFCTCLIFALFLQALPINSIDCVNVYQLSLARLVSNVIIVSNSTIKCCINDGVQNNTGDDVI